MSGTVNAGQALTSPFIGAPGWTAMTLSNGWVNATGSGPAAQWRYLQLFNMIEVIMFVESGTITNGTLVGSGITPVPAHAVSLPVLVFGNSAAPVSLPTIVLNTAGQMLIENFPTGTTQFTCHLFFPLDS